MNRRESLSVIAGATAAAATAGVLGGARAIAQAQPAAAGPFRLPPLGYGYDALEPYIDTITMSIRAAEQFSNTVSVIDPSTNTNLGVIRFGDPQPMNLSPLYKRTPEHEREHEAGTSRIYARMKQTPQ
jgi:YVTN family beta-propeller protein